MFSNTITSAKCLYVVFLFAIFIPYSSLAHSKKLDSLGENEIIDIVISEPAEITAACTKMGVVISYKNIKILCAVGFISSDDSKIPFESFDVVFARSGGGDVQIAMQIGRIIHSQNVPIIISEFCLSSCANYIVPASREIVILENSYIGFHGSPSRNLAEVENLIKEDRRKNGALDNFPQKNLTSRIEDKRNLIHEEVDYYLDIGVIELYARSYRHTAKRSNRASLPSQCRVQGKMYHILGPEYAKAYGLNVKMAWYPSNQNDFEKFVTDIPGYSYMFDMDEYPFYIQGMGFVKPEDCTSAVQRVKP